MIKVKYKQSFPPRVKEIITPTKFVDDFELVEKVIDEMMITTYVQILFICSLVLILVVMF